MSTPVLRAFSTAALLLLASCDNGSDAGDDAFHSDDPPGSSGAGASGAGPADPRFTTMAALHEQAVATTCTLNNGVCHNSKEYPDLHTVANLLAMVDRPCNVNAAAHEDVHEACEPEGDRLVVPSAGIDAIVARVEVEPTGAATDEIESVRLILDGDVAAVIAGEIGFEIRRGDDAFHFGEVSYYAAAAIASSDATSVTIDVSGSHASIKAFFDDRVYPWNDSMIRVGDPNGNGTLGFATSVRMIVPGDPMQSFLILRLIDESYGDLMPRQCRTWDDQATRALGCWIAGLQRDESGAITNADDPIDYDTCDFDPVGKGICGTGEDSESIFARSCGGAKCHIGDEQPAAGLDLSPGKARESLIGVPSTQVSGMKLVEPGAPEKSYLVCKLAETCAERQGARMPSGLPALPEADLAALQQWIAAGAQ